MRRAGTILVILFLLGGALQPARAGPDNRLGHRGLKLKARNADNRTSADGFLPSEIECTASGQPDNLNLDCDDPVTPNNEPHIIVDPEDPDHIIASSNDYESCCDGFYTTFDGGRTWRAGDMSAEGPTVVGSDPVTAIDPVTGNAIHSSLNFEITPEGFATNGDVVVSVSEDGGLTWEKPVVVDEGFGADPDPVKIFNDKEWIVTDTDPDSPLYGRTYLTWTKFRFESAQYVESPIFEAHSDDGGETWSDPQEISGTSQRFCGFQIEGAEGECDEDQGSVPTVAPDGTVYVAFQNEQHEAAWEPGETCGPDVLCESQYLVVSSGDGGETWSDPAHVVDQEDGPRDMPLNVNDSPTLTGYQVRIPTFGNIVASPLDGTLYLSFADNRAGKHDVVNPVTDTNVWLMISRNGVDWRGPFAVTKDGHDQWFPFADVDPTTGEVGVIYHDRRNGVYNTTLAEGGPGSWTYAELASEPSHPRNSLFFRAAVEGCWKCATFHGDYLALDYGSDGSANTAWTDMRSFVDVKVTRGFTENIFFSRL